MGRRSGTAGPETTAHHEAGHAVAAFSSRKRIHEVSIRADHDIGVLGYVKSTGGIGQAITYGEPDRYLRLVTENVTILFAGVVAEQEHTRGRHNWVGARSDRREASSLAGRILSDDELPAYLRWLMVRTRALVRWRWCAVDALAQALLVREVVSGRDATEIIRRTLYPPVQVPAAVLRAMERTAVGGSPVRIGNHVPVDRPRAHLSPPDLPIPTRRGRRLGVPASGR